MKKISLPIFFLILLFQFVHAQAPLVKVWDARFGGYMDETLIDFLQTNDGGYILGGETWSDSSGDVSEYLRGYNDFWIVKTDSLGNKIWDKRFGGNNRDYFNSLKQTFDGGYILGGSSWSDSSGDVSQPCKGFEDYWIVKIDPAGNKQWDKRFGGNGYDALHSLQQTSDGGYILGGYSASDSSGDISQHTRGNYDYWIVKTDSLGNKQWDKRFGGLGDDILRSLRQTPDGGFILGGWTVSDSTGEVSQHTRGNIDYWLLKIDSLGNKQWDKRFGGGYDELLNSVQQTFDGGFMLGGSTSSDSSGDVSQHTCGNWDYWLVKTDAFGNKQWAKRSGGSHDENGVEGFGNAIQTFDKGYLLAGTSYSPISGDKTEINLGEEQTWIVKTDSLGNKQWDKTIFTRGHDEQGLAIQTKDCFVFSNFTNADTGGYKTQSSQGRYDYWMVKFCDSIFTTNLSSPFNEMSFSIFPNPTTGIFNVECKMQNAELKIYNPFGQFIHQQIFKSENQQIDLSNQPKGIYFIELTANNKREVQKLILQ